MAGLIFLAALAGLVTLLVYLSRLATQSLPISGKGKTLLRWLIVVGAFPLPLADEIIGKYQFEALCKANGIESADVSRARGKRVKMTYTDKGFVESGVLLPTKQDDISLRDADTEEVLLSYKSYFSYGGWLMRYTPISMGSSGPMLFKGNGCGYGQEQQIFSSNQITLTN